MRRRRTPPSRPPSPRPPSPRPPSPRAPSRRRDRHHPSAHRGPGRAVTHPEVDAVQHARELAWTALNRREHTEAELRWLLTGKRARPDAIEEVIAELAEQGYIDDASYARRYAEDRRRLDAWGSERIERRLLAAGVAPEHIAGALDAGGDELEAALELLRRRVPRPPETLLERDRALGMLLRKGYEREVAYDAVRRHAGAADEF